MPVASKTRTVAKKTGAKKITPRSKPAKPPEIVPLSAGNSSFIRVCVYSPPGQGKTSLAGTSPRCLILEADRGVESAIHRGSQAEKWIISDYDDLVAAYSYLRLGGTQDYDWVWLDSGTLFQERGLDQIMDDLHALKPHREVWAPDRGEYGQNMNRFTRIIRDFKDLPINFGITAHTMRTEDEDGEVTYMPAFQGNNVPQKICSYMGLVGRMELKEKDGKEYTVVDFRGTGKYYGKDRYGGKLGRMTNPTIPKITAVINGTAPARAKTKTTNTRKKVSA